MFPKPCYADKPAVHDSCTRVLYRGSFNKRSFLEGGADPDDEPIAVIQRLPHGSIN